MNPKITLFLSVTLTAFVVAILSGIVNKVTSTPPVYAMAPVQVQQAATATLEQPTATDLPLPTEQTLLSPEQAAALAAQAINRQDVYSVETSTYNGVDAYKVVFSSGNIVYIGLDSQVLTKAAPKQVVVSVPATKKPRHRKGDGGGNSQPSNSQPSNDQPSQPSSNNGGENDGGGSEGGD